MITEGLQYSNQIYLETIDDDLESFAKSVILAQSQHSEEEFEASLETNLQTDSIRTQGDQDLDANRKTDDSTENEQTTCRNLSLEELDLIMQDLNKKIAQSSSKE
ncbi:MAG: hypothetical protein MHMPM18_000924 [Marteilia pararefringens]